MVYLVVAALVGTSAYGYTLLASQADSQEVALQKTQDTLREQRDAYAAYNRLVATRVTLATAGTDTSLLDTALADLKILLSTEKFTDATTLALQEELAAGVRLDTFKTEQAKSQEEALKSGTLLLTIVNGASAEVVVKQGDVATLTTTADGNGVVTASFPVGTYSVIVSKYGFTSTTTTDVALLGAQTTPLNLTLELVPVPTPTPTVKATSTPKATAVPTATPAPASSSTAHSSYRRTTVASSRGSFTADIMEFELGAGKIKVATDTASDTDCAADCATMAVKSYVQRHAGAVAGINGTYFCAADYSTCGAEKGHFFWKVYNTRLSRMINASSGLGEGDPFLIFDSVGNPTFLSYWYDYSSYSIAAGINHKPAVVRNGSYSVDENALDTKQRTSKVARAAIGVSGKTLYVVVVQSATVMDLGAVMVAVGATNALNLDGGGSSAIYYNGEYKRGPGRGVPNAIVFIEQ
jgi:exopolysaccharide biosynthesis protein